MFVENLSLLKLVIKFIEVKWENSNSFLFEISFEFIKEKSYEYHNYS